jgi:hypothetical protein
MDVHNEYNVCETKEDKKERISVLINKMENLVHNSRDFYEFFCRAVVYLGDEKLGTILKILMAFDCDSLEDFYALVKMKYYMHNATRKGLQGVRDE